MRLNVYHYINCIATFKHTLNAWQGLIIWCIYIKCKFLFDVYTSNANFDLMYVHQIDILIWCTYIKSKSAFDVRTSNWHFNLMYIHWVISNCVFYLMYVHQIKIDIHLFAYFMYIICICLYMYKNQKSEKRFDVYTSNWILI